MNKTINIFWFRRDLRLEDNKGLFEALQSENNVLPIFIFDTTILDRLDSSDSRVSFIHENILRINQQLAVYGSGIKVLHGEPLAIFNELAESYTIQNVFSNVDYEPYAIERDYKLALFFHEVGIQFHQFKDHVIFEKNNILKKDGSPYTVYTPYSKQWLSLLKSEYYQSIPSEQFLNKCVKFKSNVLSLTDLGFTKSNICVKAFSLDQLVIDQYQNQRDFPGIKGTSSLSPHLRFGTISIRKCVNVALQAKNQTFLKELIWREFFIQILWHFPESSENNFKSKYNRIAWRNNEDEFKAWCEGNTGYPLVDAGMRELNATGYMHNRVRMVTASFLCKHLLIDWRWGAAYFASKLLDFDLAQNAGNWQWSAGTGCDSAPYFRIFNPSEQLKKFDKDFKYTKKWVPEFQELYYPQPIVVHQYARERCLKTYKEALN